MKVEKSWRRSNKFTRLVLCLPYGSVWQATGCRLLLFDD